MNLNSFLFIIAVLLAIADQNDGKELSQSIWGGIPSSLLLTFDQDDLRRLSEWYRIGRASNVANRIAGGYDANKGEFPSFVGIVATANNSTGLCSATLISDQLVLTAAHCIPNAANETIDVSMQALPFGTKVSEIERLGIKADKVCWSKDFKLSDMEHPYALWDYAIMRLEKPIELSEDVHPAWLPEEPIRPDQDAHAVGIGLTYALPPHTYKFPEIVQALSVSLTQCKKQDIHETHICFRHRDYAGHICKGDSGGPVLAEVDGHQRVFGIASYGDIPGSLCRKEVLTNTTHADVYSQLDHVLELIRRVMGPSDLEHDKVKCATL